MNQCSCYTDARVNTGCVRCYSPRSSVRIWLQNGLLNFLLQTGRPERKPSLEDVTLDSHLLPLSQTNHSLWSNMKSTLPLVIHAHTCPHGLAHTNTHSPLLIKYIQHSRVSCWLCDPGYMHITCFNQVSNPCRMSLSCSDGFYFSLCGMNSSEVVLWWAKSLNVGSRPCDSMCLPRWSMLEQGTESLVAPGVVFCSWPDFYTNKKLNFSFGEQQRTAKQQGT